MRRLLPFFALALLAGSAQAAPSFQLTWNSCTGPLDRCVAAGTSDVRLYASVLGQNTPHAGFKYVVKFDDPSPFPVPDAWRFDPVGCEESLSDLNYTPPPALAKLCPTFEGVGAQHNLDSYQYDPGTGSCQLTMASGYAAGNFTAVDPAVRYMLGEVVFNFTFAVVGPGNPGIDCGGLERPMAITLVDAFWVDTAFQQQAFTLGSTSLTANAAGSDCFPVPAHPVTWGAIRAQYR